MATISITSAVIVESHSTKYHPTIYKVDGNLYVDAKALEQLVRGSIVFVDESERATWYLEGMPAVFDDEIVPLSYFKTTDGSYLYPVERIIDILWDYQPQSLNILARSHADILEMILAAHPTLNVCKEADNKGNPVYLVQNKYNPVKRVYIRPHRKQVYLDRKTLLNVVGLTEPIDVASEALRSELVKLLNKKSNTVSGVDLYSVTKSAMFIQAAIPQLMHGVLMLCTDGLLSWVGTDAKHLYHLFRNHRYCFNEFEKMEEFVNKF